MPNFFDSEFVQEAIHEIELASKNTDGVSGIPTGFHDLDKVTSGWQRSDMIVLAARPGMGKTAFVLSMARNTAVEYGKGVAIFSLEMSSVQLVKRLIASESRLSAEKLRKGDLKEHEFQQLHTRITKLAEAPIFIDDTPGINIFDFRAKCRRLKAQYNIDLVIIDYLQLMSARDSKSGGNREQEISTISRSIKEIAKELNVPIIALSQLSRSVETRGGDKRPMLSDLRESGAIEQDAEHHVRVEEQHRRDHHAGDRAEHRRQAPAERQHPAHAIHQQGAHGIERHAEVAQQHLNGLRLIRFIRGPAGEVDLAGGLRRLRLLLHLGLGLGHQLRRISGVADHLGRVTNLAHRLIEGRLQFTLEPAAHLLEFGVGLTELPNGIGQLLGPENDKSEEQDDDDLAALEIEHVFESTGLPSSEECNNVSPLVSTHQSPSRIAVRGLMHRRTPSRVSSSH